MPDTNHWPSATATRSTLDKDGNWLAADGSRSPATPAPCVMATADTFIVMVGIRSRTGHTNWEPWSFSTTEEAVELIGEVERGERKGQIGSLTAWKDGKIIGEIPTGTATQEARQDRRDDAEHARLFSNGGL